MTLNITWPKVNMPTASFQPHLQYVTPEALIREGVGKQLKMAEDAPSLNPGGTDPYWYYDHGSRGGVILTEEEVLGLLERNYPAYVSAFQNRCTMMKIPQLMEKFQADLMVTHGKLDHIRFYVEKESDLIPEIPEKVRANIVEQMRSIISHKFLVDVFFMGCRAPGFSPIQYHVNINVIVRPGYKPNHRNFFVRTGWPGDN